jgi:hypothetical protein
VGGNESNWSIWSSYSDTYESLGHSVYLEDVQEGTYQFTIGGYIGGIYQENNNSNQYFNFTVGVFIPDEVETYWGNQTVVNYEEASEQLGISEGAYITMIAMLLIVGMTIFATISGEDRTASLTNGSSVFILGTLVFAIIGWLPQEFIFLYITLAGVLVALWVGKMGGVVS